MELSSETRYTLTPRILTKDRKVSLDFQLQHLRKESLFVTVPCQGKNSLGEQPLETASPGKSAGGTVLPKSGPDH